MANPALERVPNYPFTSFNFAVEINVDPVSNQICSASFSECDGLEMTVEAKTIREGATTERSCEWQGPSVTGR